MRRNTIAHLEKEMATQSSILVWRIPCTEEPGELQSMGWQRIGHVWVTHTHTHTHTPLHTIGLFAILLAVCHLLLFFPYHFLFPFWKKYHILSLVTCRMFTLRPPPKKVLLLNSSKWVSRQLPTVGRVCFSSSTTPYLRPHPPQGDPHPVTEWGGSITAVLFPPHVRH